MRKILLTSLMTLMILCMSACSVFSQDSKELELQVLDNNLNQNEEYSYQELEKKLADLEQQMDEANYKLYSQGELLKELKGWLEVEQVGEEGLVIYSANSETYKTIPIGAIQSNKALPLEEQLQLLVPELLSSVFKEVGIEVKEIKEIDNKKVAVINLQDNRSAGKGWQENYFGGSCGGTVTSTTLIETFLQRNYNGEWVDGVIFTHNGKEIDSYHVELLEKINYRE